ncbi:MAG: hypothetical protein ACFFD4_17835 [Candidatus Odinarchaeota archaeon]
MTRNTLIDDIEDFETLWWDQVRNGIALKDYSGRRTFQQAISEKN